MVLTNLSITGINLKVAHLERSASVALAKVHEVERSPVSSPVLQKSYAGDPSTKLGVTYFDLKIVFRFEISNQTSLLRWKKSLRIDDDLR